MNGFPWVGSIHIFNTTLERAAGPVLTGGPQGLADSEPRILGDAWALL